jgi:hypothetical protein
LHVVDSQDDRALPGEEPKRFAARYGKTPHIGRRRPGILEEQRRAERPLLRAGEIGENLRQGVSKEVVQAGKR